MPRLRLHTSCEELVGSFAAIRTRLGVPTDMAPAAQQLASQRAAAGPLQRYERADRRDVELISIDPTGSRDLDQALHLQRDGSGYRFFYAIADVAAWVEPKDAIDTEARRRGTTVYCPDVRLPLHPLELSEGAASLLEGVDRPALLWEISLDQRGEIRDARVTRAAVRNRHSLSYTEVQGRLDDGTTDERLRLLEDVGHLRRELETARGGASLVLPDQQVERDGDHFTLRYEPTLAAEAHNAQLSLCCGIAAAKLLIDAGFGILRTVPPAAPDALDRLHRQASALGAPWPAGGSYAEFVRSIDPTTAAGAALMEQCAQTLQGSGYLAFDGNLPPEHRHAAIAADYAHVTAPLRRLIDRFSNECVLAACAGGRPPQWVTESFDSVPAIMAETSRRAHAVDRAAVDVMEAAVLRDHVGALYDAVVTSVRHEVATVQLLDPAVITTIRGAELTAGSNVRLRLDAADLDAASVRFSVVTP